MFWGNPLQNRRENIISCKILYAQFGHFNVTTVEDSMIHAYSSTFNTTNRRGVLRNQPILYENRAEDFD